MLINFTFQIKFEEFARVLHLPSLLYHSLEAVFVHGRPNVTHFGVENLDGFPANIMTTDTGVVFNKLSRQSPVMTKEHLAGKPDAVEGYGVWKGFFNKVPTEVEVRDWISHMMQ